MNRPARALPLRVPRIAEAAVERARLAVVPRRRSRASRFPFLFLVSAMMVSGVVGVLLFTTEMQKAAFSGRQMEAERASLTVRNEALKQEISSVSSYQSVARAAQAEGMVLPGTLPFLSLADGTVSGEPVVARAEDRIGLDRAAGTDPYAGVKARAAAAARQKEAAARAQEQARLEAQRKAQKKAQEQARKKTQKTRGATGNNPGTRSQQADRAGSRN